MKYDTLSRDHLDKGEVTMNNEFREIKNAEDARAFVGQLVAYQTNMFYFGAGRETWSSSSEGLATYFGYVNEGAHYFAGRNGNIREVQEDPHLSRLLRPKAVHAQHTLSSEVIGEQSHNPNNQGDGKQQGYIKMRLATDKEKMDLRAAFRNSMAVVEYNNTNLTATLSPAL
jgi:hypothetical protein